MEHTNEVTKVKRRNDYLELVRFIASLLIMITHLFYLEIPWGTYCFTYSWIYVEFFFMLTGYFTTRHFMNKCDNSILNKITVSITYTVKKFVKFIPYSIVIVPCAYFLSWWPYIKTGSVGDVPLLIKWFLSEIFFLSEFFQYPMYSGTLWYLCAMLSVFPVFCILLQINNDKVKFFLTALAGGLYYGIYGVSGLRDFPHDLLRAFSCLCLGTVVFYLSKYVGKLKTDKKADVALTIVEISAMLVTVVISGFNMKKLLMVALFMFILTLTITFSGKSYTGNIQCNLFGWLGKLSISIFMWQWTWESFMMIFMRKYGFRRRVVVYFIGTLALAVGHTFVVELLGKLMKKLIQSRKGEKKE